MYGPLPAECVLNQFCALSALGAFAASVAPFARASLLFTIPADSRATSSGTAGFGCVVVMTTVEGPRATTLLNVPVTIGAGEPLRFFTRSRLKTTSADVSGSPLLNLTP